METTVEVYRRDNYDGRLRLMATFPSLEDLVFNTGSFENFSCVDSDRCRYNLHRWDPDRNKTIFEFPARTWLLDSTTFCYVVYNANGKIVPPDMLVGTNRRVNRERRRRWFWNYHPGSKRSNGHCYRHMKTTQERRWAHAWDDEEFAPKPRASRQGHNLPNVYDDYWRGSDGKSWKNYRKTQWKG